MTADVSGSYSGAAPAKHSGHGRTAMAVFGGAAVLVGGVLLFNPVAAARTLALLTGFSLLLHGIGRTALAVTGRAEIPGWGWLALAGVINIVLGILALVWPEATVLVLSFVLGFQAVAFGVIVLIAAFSGSRSHA